MSEFRTALQCQARGCDGCVVCDRENYTQDDLLQYRAIEKELNERMKDFPEFNNG